MKSGLAVTCGILVSVLRFIQMLYVVLAAENDGVFFYLDGVAGVTVSGPPCGKTVSASVTEDCSPLVRCSVCNQPRAKFFAQL